MAQKLLLADDSVTIQRVIELTFADENIQVVAVGDGQQAMTRIDAEPPDIVLADIGMPERDGYEVAAHVKGNPRTAHIPVLLLTGAFEPIDEARAHAVGCDGVLVKPFEPQMVINRVKDLLAGRRPASLWASPGGPPAPSGATSPAPGKPVDATPKIASPSAPRADSPGGEAKSLESLDDYFDRLDAAFSTDAAPAAGFDAPLAAPEAHGDFGTWDIPFESRQGGSAPEPAREPPAAPAAPSPATRGAAPVPPPNEIPTIAPESSPAAQAPALADAFAALLAAEQKVGVPAAPPAASSLDEAAIDEIARRVASRLTGDAVRSTVLDVAERLVREEIERIKQQAKL